MTVQASAARAYEARAWQLTELLPDADEATVADRLAELEEQVAEFERLRESLHPEMDSAGLSAVLDRYTAMVEAVYVLSGYATLRFSADTRSEARFESGHHSLSR